MTKNNKRHYANDYYRGKKTGTYEMIFLDGTVEIYISGERGDDTSIYEEKKTAKCHFDKDYIYIDGDAGHILKLNNKRLVIEGKDNGELTHMEFFRIEDNNSTQSTPQEKPKNIAERLTDFTEIDLSQPETTSQEKPKNTAERLTDFTKIDLFD